MVRDPSIVSRMMSAWPACCAVSAMRCSTTRRADQRKETAACNLERDIVDRQRIAEAFAQMFERDAGGGSGHGATLCAAGRGVKGGPKYTLILPFAGRPSLGYAHHL